jgi:hypothetical protein
VKQLRRLNAARRLGSLERREEDALSAPEYHVRQGDGAMYPRSQHSHWRERPCYVGRSVQQRRVSGSMGPVGGGGMTGGTETRLLQRQPWLASSVGQSVSQWSTGLVSEDVPALAFTRTPGARTAVCWPLSHLDDVPCAGGDTRHPLLTDLAILASIHCDAADEDPQRPSQHMEPGRKALRRLTGKESKAKAAKGKARAKRGCPGSAPSVPTACRRRAGV